MRKSARCFISILFLAALFSMAPRFSHEALADNVVLKVLAMNPSKEKDQEVPIRTSLPAEVKPEHIVNRDDLNIQFDLNKSVYFVEKKVKLKPGQTYTLEVQIEDIWVIPDERLQRTQDRADRAMKILEGSYSQDVAKILYDNISQTVTNIRAHQAEANTELPHEHIAAYRLNLKLMEQVDKDLVSLEEIAIKMPGGARQIALSQAAAAAAGELMLGTNQGAGGGAGGAGDKGGTGAGGGDQAGDEGSKSFFGSINFTWKLILAIVAFLAILSTGSLTIWQRQLRDLTRMRDISLLPTEEREGLKKRLIAQATTDELTGMYNIGHFKLLMKTELRTARMRKDKEVCVIMGDVDYFKEVNDKFGHPAGNEVLKAVAKTFQEKSTNLNISCRYGGEEFLMLLPGYDTEAADEMAEKIRKAVQERQFFLGDKKTPHSVTISLGVAMYNRAETAEELIARADKALYQAKQGGRNRVVIGETPTPEAGQAITE